MIDIVKPEEALKLKELGFNEPISKYYLRWHDGDVADSLQDSFNQQKHNSYNHKVSAPTFAEAFRWFRTKFLFSEYRVVWGASGFFYSCYILYKEDDVIKVKYLEEDNHTKVANLFMPKLFNTYEEAELEGLKNLITIYENQLALQKEKEQGNTNNNTQAIVYDEGGYQIGT